MARTFAVSAADREMAMLKYWKAREQDKLLPRLFSLVGECGEKGNEMIYG